jgi:SAM-dependent methyltransferase
LLHLACANGNDTLSWAVLGAAVTGVDIAPAGLAVARQTAAAAGLDAAFVCADVYDLPPELPAFDIVYMSGGGICWMPDLDRRAQLVAAHLVPGGVAAIIEHHPLWDRLAAGHRADLVHLAGRRRAGEPQQGRPARDPLRRAPGAGHVRRARAAGRLAARLLFGPGQPSRLAAGTAPAQALGVDRSAHRAHAAELTGARTGRTLRG